MPFGEMPAAEIPSGGNQVVGSGLGGGFFADGVGQELIGVQACAFGFAVAAGV